MGDVEVTYTLTYTQEHQGTGPVYYKLYVSYPRELDLKPHLMSSDVDLEGILAIIKVPSAVSKELRAKGPGLKAGESITIPHKIPWPPTIKAGAFLANK